MVSEEKELEKKINFIVSSRLITEIDGVPVFFTLPILHDKQIADYYYEVASKEFKFQKIPTIDDTIKDHKNKGLWSDKKDLQIEILNKSIKDVEIEIKDTKQPSKIKKLKNWKGFLERSLIELYNAKNTMLANTVEALSNERAMSYLIWCCFTDLYNKKLWISYNDLLKSCDINLIKSLINKFIELSSYFSISDIRRIARSTYWRIRWNCSKNNPEDLFGRPLLDISNDQFLLIYWSQVYDSVYESMERPPNDIIDDDDKLDEWLIQQNDKHSKEVKQRYHGKGTIKNSPINKAGEVFKTVEGYYNRDGIFVQYTEDEKWKMIGDIQKSNNQFARQILQRQEKELSQKPGILIQEGKLRRSGREVTLMGGQLKGTK